MLKKISEKIFNVCLISGVAIMILALIVGVIGGIIANDAKTMNEICLLGGMIFAIHIIFIAFPLTIILKVIDEFKENSKKES